MRTYNPRTRMATGLRRFANLSESVHADYVSRHTTRDEAVAVIEQLVRDGLAEPEEFIVREIDAAGKTVRVFGVPDPAARRRSKSPERWSSSGR